MTPLATYLSRQLTSRPRNRKDIWREQHNINLLRSSLDDIHCFEVTQAFPLISELESTFGDAANQKVETLFETYSFLPAPKTWIEWVHSSGNRIGLLLEQGQVRLQGWGDRPMATCTFFCRQFAEHAGYLSGSSRDYWDGHPRATVERHLPKWLDIHGKGPTGAFPVLLSSAHCMLLLINSPKIIGRAQHMPDANLERRMLKGFAGGAFPLHAWTELKLHVNKPPEIDDGEPHEAHLTGRRALHFVRKHIRIRRGQLEYVSAHWRGDPSIGIKQTRYVVAP